MKQLKYDVEYLDDAATPRVVRVRIILADRLATELHGHKYGLLDVKAQGQLAYALWLFHAMMRQGDIPDSTTFAEFQSRVLADGPVEEAGEVPPTPESDASASGSPSTSPESTGSTSSDLATTN